jgi:hypothetical protein
MFMNAYLGLVSEGNIDFFFLSAIMTILPGFAYSCFFDFCILSCSVKFFLKLDSWLINTWFSLFIILINLLAKYLYIIEEMENLNLGGGDVR